MPNTEDGMRRGFTLLECALILLVLILIGLIVTPCIIRQRRMAERASLIESGRSIGILLLDVPDYVREDAIRQHEEFRRADPSRFTSSTELFRDFLVWQWPQPPFTMLGGGGVPRCRSSEPSAFKSENNAWCLVARPDLIDSLSSERKTPVLFTRNVSADWIGAQAAPVLTDERPFGTNGWVFITRGLSGHYAEGDMIRFWATGLPKRMVLRP